MGSRLVTTLIACSQKGTEDLYEDEPLDFPYSDTADTSFIDTAGDTVDTARDTGEAESCDYGILEESRLEIGERLCLDFSVLAEDAGLGQTSVQHTGLTAFDYDADGYGDLLILNYGRGLQLFRNLADGRFEETSDTSNIDELTSLSESVHWKSAAPSDMDGDDDIDLALTGSQGYQ